MVKIKVEIEKAILIVFFAVMLLAGPGMLFANSIAHDFPYAYFASDSFQHQIRAESIKDMGDFRYEADYISKGLENAVGRYPPVLYHLAVIFSHASGIEVYDSIYFMVAFFAIVSVFVMYLIIRDFNRNVALLSLPIFLLIFSSPVSSGFLWGHWPSILSQSFLMLFFWSMMRVDLGKSFVFIGILLSAIFLAHSSEFVFAILFLGLFFLAKAVGKKFGMKDIKTMLLAFLVFSILVFYYIPVFLGTWVKAQPYSFGIDAVWDGNPGFYIAGFGLLLIPILIGIAFSFQKIKEIHISLIIAFAMLLAGFLNYAGFQLRSFQIRFFWPIYLAVFFGFGIYILFKIAVREVRPAHAIAMSIIMVFLLLGIFNIPGMMQTDVQTIPYIPQLSPAPGQGLMDSLHWESLEWLAENTAQDAKVYFFYGDIYSQDALLRNSKRVHSQVDPDDFVKALQDREVKRIYITETPGDTGGSISIRESFFRLSEHPKSLEPGFGFKEQDVCSFDYLVFDRASSQDVLAQYNILIANSMLENGASLAFENNLVVILKNNKVDGDCIEEGKF